MRAGCRIRVRWKPTRCAMRASSGRAPVEFFARPPPRQVGSGGGSCSRCADTARSSGPPWVASPRATSASLHALSPRMPSPRAPSKERSPRQSPRALAVSMPGSRGATGGPPAHLESPRRASARRPMRSTMRRRRRPPPCRRACHRAHRRAHRPGICRRSLVQSRAAAVSAPWDGRTHHRPVAATSHGWQRQASRSPQSARARGGTRASRNRRRRRAKRARRGRPRRSRTRCCCAPPRRRRPPWVAPRVGACDEQMP